MKRWLLLIAATVVLAPLGQACSCAWPGRPCRAFADTTGIFSGRVTNISDVKIEGEYEQRLVRLQILEAFKGVSGATVEVVTGQGGGDCGFGFRVGEEYLVYAHASPKNKRLYTGICTRTRKLSDAGEDLAHFRQKDDPKLGVGIVGQVEKLRRVPENSTHTEWDGWWKNGKLILTRDGRRWETTTGRAGEFAVWGLTPGTYKLEARVPAGYVGGTIEKVEIKPGTACAEQRILILPEWKRSTKTKP